MKLGMFFPTGNLPTGDAGEKGEIPDTVLNSPTCTTRQTEEEEEEEEEEEDEGRSFFFKG